MPDFDPNAYAPEPAPAAQETSAPKFDPEAYSADIPHGEALGVIPVAPPDVGHTDPAIVSELQERVDARRVGDEPPARSAALAAFRAQNAQMSSAQGQAALVQADRSGLSPSFVSRSLQTTRLVDDSALLESTLQPAPILSDYMAQSSAHAAALADDAEPHGFIEWLLGKWNRAEPVNAVGPFAESQRRKFGTLPDGAPLNEPLIPGAWEQFYAKALFTLKRQMLDLAATATSGQRDLLRNKDLSGRMIGTQIMGGADLNDGARAQLAGSADEALAQEKSEITGTRDLAEADVPGTQGHLGRQIVGHSIEAVPGLLSMYVGGMPVIAAQTFADLSDNLSRQKNDDGSQRFSDEEVRNLSLAGSTATALLLGNVGKKLASSTVGKLFSKASERALGETAANGVIEHLIESNALWKNLAGRGLQFSEAMAHGIGFMAGQSLINNTVEQVGNVMTGGKYDPSKAVQAVKEGTKSALEIFPLMALAPVAGGVHDVGRAWKAHADAVDFAASIEAAKQSSFIKNAPDHAKKLIDQQSGQDPNRSTAFIPVEEFDRLMAEMEQDPAQVAGAFEDQGAAYQEAKNTGGDVAIPMSEVLTKLAPAGLADNLALDVKIDADPNAVTARQAQQPPPPVEAHELATAINEAAAADEPKTTAFLQSMESDGARLVGLPTRLKTVESIERNLSGYLKRVPNSTSLAAAQEIRDALRYTFEISPDRYAAQVQKTIRTLAERGYQVTKPKNFWGGEIYKGVNASFRSPTGQLVEIQFHTPDSFKAVKDSHGPYEEYRTEGGAPERKEELHQQMRKIWNAVGVPAGAADLKFGPVSRPGETMRVYRLASAEAAVLENANAGNASGVADHLARVQGASGPVPKGGIGDTIHAFDVILGDEFGKYTPYNQGAALAAEMTGRVGRSVRGPVEAYSFPKGGRFQVKYAGSVPLKKVLSDLQAKGFEDFDDSGIDAGAQVIENALPPPPKEPPPAAAQGPAEKPPRAQSPGLAAAGARAKEARDLDSAMSAYAANRVAQMEIGKIRPATYEQQARTAALKMQQMATEIERVKAGASETRVITPQNQQGEPAHYKLVEAGDLITSHTANSFAPDPRYPTFVQERDYSAEKGEQQKVARGGRFLEPSLVLADTPTAVDGPPLVTSGGEAIALGGNGRSMMLKRAYEEKGDAAERYRAALREKASHFGIDPAQVDAMKQPVLVRSIDSIPSDAQRPDLVAAVRRYNEGLTQQLSPRLRAVAEARVLSPQTVASIGDVLGKGDKSLRELLREQPQDFLRILERDGVINAQNRAQWTAGDELTDEAKDRIEGMFLGRVIGSGERLQATAPSIANKIERAVPSLLRVAAAAPEADEIGDVQGALDLINEAKRRGLPLDDLLDQQSMFVESKVEPRTAAMARLLTEKGQKDLGARFKTWADAAAQEEQQGLFAAPPTSPEDALKLLFAGQKDDLSGPSRPADGSTLRTTTGSEPPERAEFALTPQAQEAGKSAKAAQQKLSDVQTQHRLADHMVDAAERAKAAAAKIREYLATSARPEKRAPLVKAGRPFVDASDAILGALGFTNRTQTANIDDFVKVVGAQDVAFDPNALKEILAKPPARQMKLGQPVKGSIDGLTPDDAQLVRTALRSIRTAARKSVEMDIAGQKQALRDVINSKVKPALESRASSGGGGGEGLSKLSAEEGQPKSKGFVGTGKTMLKEMLQPQELMRRVGLNDFYQRDFVDARNHREDLAAKIGDYFYRRWNLEMPEELRSKKLDPVEGPGGKFPGQLVRQDAWELASWMGSESSAFRAAKGIGVTEEQIYSYLDRVLSKPEWDFIQSRWDFNDKELWPLLEKHLTDKYGMPPPKIEGRPVTTQWGTYRGGYNPARYRFDIGREQGGSVPDGVSDVWGNLRKGMPATSNYFTKPRAQKHFDAPDLNWSVYSQHLQAVSHYLAFDKWVSDFGKILRDPEFRQIVRDADGLGPEALRQLEEFHRTTARGTVEPAATGAKEIADLFGGGVVRSRVGTAAFQLNLRVVAGQLSHILFAERSMGLGPANMLRGLFSTLDPRSYGDAFANSKQLGYRWNDYGSKTREMLAGIGPESRSESRKWIDTAGWSLYHWMDGFLSKAIWEAAKHKSISEQQGLPAGDRVLDANGEQVLDMKKAYQAADEAISRVMPPRNIIEQSSFARDRGVIGSLLLVRNFPNTIFNVSAMRTWDLGTGVRAAAPGWSRAKTVAGGGAAMAGALLASYLGVHLVGQYIMGHGKEEGETYNQWLARQTLAAPLYQFGPTEEAADPFIRALVSKHPISYQIHHGHEGLKASPFVDFFNQSIHDLGDVQSGNWSKKAQASLHLVSRWAGGPSPILPSLQYGYGLATGRENPRNVGGIASGLFYGKRPHQAQNPLTDLGAKP